jgi:hypothetical protein
MCFPDQDPQGYRVEPTPSLSAGVIGRHNRRPTIWLAMNLLSLVVHRSRDADD